jgi:hypothetical protein
MDVRARVVVIALIATAILLFAAAYMVMSRPANTAAEGKTESWGFNVPPPGNYLSDTTNDQGPAVQMNETVPEPIDFSVFEPRTVSENSTNEPAIKNSAGTEAETPHTVTNANTQKSTEDKGFLDNMYSLLTSFGRPSSGTVTPARSATQEALYTYGNRAGTLIQRVESKTKTHTDALVAFFEEKTDANRENILEMSGAFEDLSVDLQEMDAVPQQVAAAHEDLASGYEHIAENLRNIAETEDDEALLAAVEQYNADADVFAAAFVSVVTTFSAYDVTFTATDPGSLFVFTGTR